MRRDQLFLAEMIEAAEHAHRLAGETSAEDLSKDRQRRDALMWNFTGLGEASTQVSDELKSRFTEVGWQQPARLRNRLVHGYWTIDIEILHVTAIDFCPDLSSHCAPSCSPSKPMTFPTCEPTALKVQYLPSERDVPTESSDPARRAPVSLGPCLTCPKY